MITETGTELREWACGMYTTEAAAELLIRAFNGRFAADSNPWIKPNDNGGVWLDSNAIPDHVGVLSSGERALLLIAASIGGSTRVNLSDAVPALGREQLDLVLAAVAHANGSHRHSDFQIDQTAGTYEILPLASLYPGPG